MNKKPYCSSCEEVIIGLNDTIPNNGKIFANGKCFKTKEGYTVMILAKSKKKDYYYIMICDDNNTVRLVSNNSIKNGSIKNPYHKSVCGVGYVGVGRFSPTKDGRHTESYKRWSHIIERCYSGKSCFSSYKDVTICEDWFNFQNFAEWFYKNKVSGYHIDKDLLSPSYSKIYSPDTCVFLPGRINIFISKLEYIKSSGVSLRKSSGKYVAYVYDFGLSKLRHIGSFIDKETAELARSYAIEVEILRAQNYMRERGFSESIIDKIR